MAELVKLMLWDDGKTAYFTGNTYPYKDLIKVIPGASWARPIKIKSWQVPLENVADVTRILPSIIIDPKVIAAHTAMQNRHATAIAAKSIEPDTLNIKGIKAPNGWKPRSYQNGGVNFLDTLAVKEGGILAYDMGLGKSATGLFTFQKWLNENKADFMLVVCPSPLKYATWEEEIRLWTDIPFTIVDGDKSEVVEYDDGTKVRLSGRELREVQYQQYLFGSKIIVVNYELFLYDAKHKIPDPKAKAERKAIVDRRREELMAVPGLDVEAELKVFVKGLKKLPEIAVPSIMPPIDDRWVVILDECQRIKSPKASTTQNLVNELDNAGKKILASGTPLENNIPELWQLIDFCRKGMLGNHFKFVDRYMEKDFFNRPIAPKPQMMQELRDKIAPIMIRKTKEEAMPELPELLGPLEYWVGMTSVQRKLYKNICEGILENAKTGEFSYLEILAQITRLQQVVDSPALLREVMGDETLPVESGKLLELPLIIKDIDPNKNRFTLFSQYRQMTDILVDFLIAENILPRSAIGYVRGGMKSHDIQAIQAGFQTGDIRCVVMTTAGNYGLNLWSGSYVLAYDCLFNPQKMNQIYSRVHRSGVKNAVTALNLLTKGSYEERKLGILSKKKELFAAMVDKDDEAFAKLFTKNELLSMIDDFEFEPHQFEYDNRI